MAAMAATMNPTGETIIANDGCMKANTAPKAANGSNTGNKIMPIIPINSGQNPKI